MKHTLPSACYQVALNRKKKDLSSLGEAALSASDTVQEKVCIADVRCSRRAGGSGFYITVDGQVFGPFLRIR
jgi:hypothetical protein